MIREVTLTPRTVRPPADSGAPSENPDTGVKAGENDPKGNETSTGLPGEGSGRGSGNGNGSGGGGSDEGPGPGTHPVDHKQKIVYIRPSKRELYVRAVRRVSIRFSIHRQYLLPTGILKCLSQQNPGITVQMRCQHLFPMERRSKWNKIGLQVLHLKQENHLKSI